MKSSGIRQTYKNPIKICYMSSDANAVSIYWITTTRSVCYLRLRNSKFNFSINLQFHIMVTHREKRHGLL